VGKEDFMALIIEYLGKRPQIGENVFLAENATIIGNVVLEAGANVWYGAVLRGDAGKIRIGARTSVQDNVVVHVNDRNDTIVGADVIIGHGVVLEGCVIGDGALLGMNATILSGATVGEGALIAAGAVVKENDTIPAHCLAVGMPAISKGELSPAMQKRLQNGSGDYQKYAGNHRTAKIINNP
jgi:carbonic anhydrase/acetyltransferase-like protein (isoleucine patch superfamily)